MPWLAIPQGDARVKKLSQRFKVAGIPNLVLLDAETGCVVNMNGRAAVMSDQDAHKFPWAELATKPAATVSPARGGFLSRLFRRKPVAAAGAA